MTVVLPVIARQVLTPLPPEQAHGEAEAGVVLGACGYHQGVALERRLPRRSARRRRATGRRRGAASYSDARRRWKSGRRVMSRGLHGRERVVSYRVGTSSYVGMETANRPLLGGSTAGYRLSPE